MLDDEYTYVSSECGELNEDREGIVQRMVEVIEGKTQFRQSEGSQDIAVVSRINNLSVSDVTPLPATAATALESFCQLVCVDVTSLAVLGYDNISDLLDLDPNSHDKFLVEELKLSTGFASKGQKELMRLRQSVGRLDEEKTIHQDPQAPEFTVAVPQDAVQLVPLPDEARLMYRYPVKDLTVAQKAQALVVMLVGQTGSGKTTLINSMVCHLYFC